MSFIPRETFHQRLYFVYGFILIMVAVITYRLVNLQIANHTTWERMAENQYVGVLPDVIDRGSIYFTTHDGERVTAATIQRGYKVFLNPSMITDIDQIVTELKEIAPDLDEERIRSRAERTTDTYEEVIWRLNKEDAERCVLFRRYNYRLVTIF